MKVQQSDMQVEIVSSLQDEIKSQPQLLTKLDDYGDALLHALDPILCGSSNYQQLIPTSPLTNNNRTVALVLLPDCSYHVVIDTSWNKITIQDISSSPLTLSNQRFSRPETQDKLKNHFVTVPD
jgi:hypothetical protein